MNSKLGRGQLGSCSIAAGGEAAKRALNERIGDGTWQPVEISPAWKLQF